MPSDEQGYPVSGATDEAMPHYLAGLRAFNLYHGDPLEPLQKAIHAAPEFAMAHLLQAGLCAVATEPAANLAAQKSLLAARDLPMNDREESLFSALEKLVMGYWTTAAEALDYHCARFPHDLVALQCGHLVDFYRANSRDLRDRLARALPLWSAEIPGYSLLLGMYAFGLEETGDYLRAEEYGHSAIELEPFDCWAHHAVAHVLEMTGRPEVGIEWMKSREAFWAGEENFFKVHNWWHRALYHLDLGEQDEALALYDGPVRSEKSNMALDMVDASALLWRLSISGCDVGDRWQELAKAWEQHADGRLYPFNDWHAVMAYLGAGEDSRAEDITNSLRAGRDNEAEVSHWGWQTGLPLVEGFIAFWHGDYHRATEHLHSARYIANTFGGSHAQRDIIDWTLTEAAIRSGNRELAEAFANERLALKPDSLVNQGFIARASAQHTP
ncbi:tetratricopeptide repeat protein [Microbulbifer sp. JSM ZJ756]|uniref:tetratricopeptide repeat protein n=1 Tax=Microbulbifer sp. JSM ZJ756 TaxID=3376191 RepID=UPI00378CAED6